MNPSYLSSISPTKEKNSSRRSSREQNFAKLMYRQSVAVASGSNGSQRVSQSESTPRNSRLAPNAIPISGFPYS